MVSHLTRSEQKALKIRKGQNEKVRGTKVHKPKPEYDRKKEREEIEAYLKQGG